mgnify:CR=1 FL=1
MYYHLIMEDGLKYKDLSIEEIEKIIDEKKLSYNNSRVYSSEKKLNQIFEMYKDDLNEQQNDINLENIILPFSNPPATYWHYEKTKHTDLVTICSPSSCLHTKDRM